MNCPKCAFEQQDGGIDCLRCGIVFANFRAAAPQLVRRHIAIEELDDSATKGRISAPELRILGFGLISAIVVYAIPFTRFLFSALVTLFHELGHTIVGWLLGYPSLPAFDFVYGGGFTHQGSFHLTIALAVLAAFGYGLWLFRANRRALLLIAAIALVWLAFVTAEWRRELAIAAAGHCGELIFSGIFFYQALAGIGWRNPELERPLGAFAAFFVQIHTMLFAWRLMHDADYMAWYREGKGGALMNDLEVVALDLQIYAKMKLSISGAAALLFAFSFVPMAIALIAYRKGWLSLREIED
jgi:hypothetical protein